MVNLIFKVEGKEGKSVSLGQDKRLLSALKKAYPDTYKRFLVGRINGQLIDLNSEIGEDSEIELLTFDDEDGRRTFWHSSAHLMASAVINLFPSVKLTIGPAIEEGFYYDFYRETPFKPSDLAEIEKEMKRIAEADLPFERREVSKEEAEKALSGNKFKLELLKEIENPTFYTHGSFTDLCRGPHLPSTGYIKAFKLTKISGAYWHGDSSKEQLQRIYGISFPSREMLKEYLKRKEEAEKRDHRKLGQELDLFSIHDEAPGMPFFHPKGTVVLNELVSFMREEQRKLGYQELRTPLIMHVSLWKQSGHWDHYKENMYFVKIDNQDYAVKPMNCPGHILVYKTRKHSYKEFPLRISEFGIVHRHELSGVLSGLFRVRSFTQDDAHIFALPEQAKEEIINVINLTDKIYRTFGFDYHVELSTMPDNSMLSPEMREKAESYLKEALKELNIEYKVNPGDGAFYGPKIDFHVKDALGRTWQCATIQLDYSMPLRFDIRYMDKNGREDSRPVMIHRALYGSLERFFGILIEHFAGKFPLWISPEQVRILSVSEKFNGYAEKVREEYFKEGIRATADLRAESIGRKVREAQLNKVNYIIVVGEKEESAGTVTVRRRDNKILGSFKTSEFLSLIKDEIREKRLEDY